MTNKEAINYINSIKHMFESGIDRTTRICTVLGGEALELHKKYIEACESAVQAMENHIAWKDIKEIQPKDGQRILYSYSYEYEPGKWEHRVELDVYFSDELSTFPMCCMTHWAEAPEPVVVRN